MRKLCQLLLSFALVTSILCGCAPSVPPVTQSTDSGKMEVHFLDVGQGDATLIICDGHAMLIDTGDDSQGTFIQNYLEKQQIRHLDYLILTHPDADHIGSAPVIITKFDISKVFISNFEKSNKTYQKLIQALDNKLLRAVTPEVQSTYDLGAAEFTILAPNGVYSTPNDSSISLLVRNGNNTFLFTGDAGETAEMDMLDTGIDLHAEVYQVGHHGSADSTSEMFFEAVNPAYAVISCAEGNSYGHPHAETLNTFRENGVLVYRTDEAGTIIAVSDGEMVSFNVPASDSWESGEPSKKDNAPAAEPSTDADSTYILNTKSKKFHKPSCGSLPVNDRQDSRDSREAIIAQGYEPCKKCKP